MKQQISHKAPFDLRNQNSFFGGWPVLTDTDKAFAIVIALPVEGTEESAAVIVEQTEFGTLSAEAYGPAEVQKQAMEQALATLSLDIDDSGWQKVGKQDEVIASLQKKYSYLRPVLFHSPYEAAAGFIIGQRISVKQRQALQAKIAEQYGEVIEVESKQFSAFPGPQKILQIQELVGLNSTKLERLQGVARAAIDGKLERKYLLGLSIDDALSDLQALPGIGPFYASGILYRGAGIVDDITDDSLTKYAIKQAYSLKVEPNQTQVLQIAEKWAPYKMWCEVLVHVWLRREVGLPKRNKF